MKLGDRGIPSSAHTPQTREQVRVFEVGDQQWAHRGSSPRSPPAPQLHRTLVGMLYLVRPGKVEEIEENHFFLFLIFSLT
jgi:hypothetical protein